MPKDRHVPGPVISVMADNDLQIHCMKCNAIVRQQDLVCLIRVDLGQPWTTLCVECSIELFAGSVMNQIRVLYL